MTTDELNAEVERLQAHAELLDFCLSQERNVLNHFARVLPDPEHRRIAQGALIASEPPRADEGYEDLVSSAARVWGRYRDR